MGHQRITPPQVKAFDKLLREGWTPGAAAKKIGVSRTWAYRRLDGIKNGATADTKVVAQTEKWGEPIAPSDLSPEAKRAWDDFGYFRRRYFGRIASPWQEDAANQIVKLLNSKQKEYCVINCPPGSGKSTLFTMDIPAWLIVRNRGIRMIIGSKTANQAEAYVRRLKIMLERVFPLEGDTDAIARGHALDAEATLGQDFGAFRPNNPEIWRADSFIVAQKGTGPIDEKEPTVASFGMDSGSLGWRVNYIVWDDVVDTKVLKSEESVNAQRDWWDDVAETRLEPDGVLVLQGQRLAANDLYRYNLDKKTGAWDDDEDGEQGGEPLYSHIVYKAHYKELCTGNHRGLEPYPKSCLLDPVRLSWRELRAKQTNRAEKFAVVYQQEDVDPASVLVPKIWIIGGRDQTGFDAPGCLDRDRGLWEIPARLKGNLIGIATADPSPTKFWAVQMWAYHQPSEQRFLLDLIRRPMSAPEFLDWNYNTGEFTGVMEEWRKDALAIGVPIKYWIVEKNAAQRFMLQYDHMHRWIAKHSITVIGHETTYKNKSDSEYGIQTIAPHYQHGRVRLPYKEHTVAPSTMNPMIGEVTRYPAGTTDDCVMAHWFLEWSIPKLVTSNQRTVYRAARPSWMAA